MQFTYINPKMARIKTGLFSTDMAELSAIEELLGRFHSRQKIDYTVYSSIPASRLNGGRLNSFLLDENGCLIQLNYYGANYHENIGSIGSFMEKYHKGIDLLNKEGIGFELALTNHFASEESLQDTVLDETLEHCSRNNRTFNARNSVTYVAEPVREHIAARYPDISLTVSVIKFYSEYPAYGYGSGLDDADDIVLMHQDAADRPVLENISKKDRSRVWIISNSRCVRSCTPKTADDHYRNISRFNAGPEKNNSSSESLVCSFNTQKPGEAITLDLPYLSSIGYSSYKVGRMSLTYHNNMGLLQDPLEQAQKHLLNFDRL